MNHQNTFWKIVLVVLLAPLPIGAWALGSATFDWWQRNWLVGDSPHATIAPVRVQLSSGMVHIAGGPTLMGGRHNPPADQLPVHELRIDSFWISQHPVTNDQFDAFVTMTGYVTTAERRGASLVFDIDRGRWLQVKGASWREPQGPRSSLVARSDFPVVHVSWHDAQAYADWSGKRLVTESEYEFAARGGLLDTRYAWGESTPTAQVPLANYWQGPFPSNDLGLDGFQSLAPVAQFPPNRWGLFDMVGNVWCWCGDWYAADYYTRSRFANPQGPVDGDERILRGGSWLSTAGVPNELSLAARGHAPPNHTAGNVGFRCASSKKSPHKGIGMEMANSFRGAPRR